MPRTRSGSAIVGIGSLFAIGACSPRGATFDGVPLASQRMVAAPSSIAALAQGDSFAGLPSAITFGDPNGRSALFLQFPATWRAHGAPLKGFLALEPRAGATPDAEPVTIQVWRVRGTWDSSTLRAWSDKPELAPPYAETVISSSPARTLRIEITDLLRFAADNPDLDHGFGVIARRGSGHGASFATGMGGGSAPQLEVYTR
jgi:hypothetical protein